MGAEPRAASTCGHATSAKVTSNVIKRCILDRFLSEHEANLRRQAVNTRLVPQKCVVVLKLKGYGFAGVKTDPQRWSMAQGNIGKHRLILRHIHILVTKIRPVQTILPGNL